MQQLGNCKSDLKRYSMNMSYKSFEEYQYDSCIARGICSINPRISALQTVIVLYLRLFAKYSIDLNIDQIFRDFILNTISVTIYNPDFNEKTFLFTINKFKEILPKVMINFGEKFPNNDMKIEEEKALELFKETEDIISAIKFGERIFNRSFEEIPTEIRDLYNIMLVISKSLSINLLDLQSFEKENSDAFLSILKLLSKINLEEKNIKILKDEIFDAAKTDIYLMKSIREAQEERYGKQKTAEVSYSTIPNKAVLVVGSNIKELEIILEALKEEDIDIYTHDDMMLAHTFPKFKDYPKLKGQFGQGLENCLLDFATFPGPIILTKNSLHNIENFYRGRLFTTDYSISPKGIIKIENNDFSKVIQSAEQAKGFKSGKQCESVIIGYDYEKIINEIKSKIENNNYQQIFIIGIDGYSLEQKTYFEKLIKLAPKDILILSFSYNIERENLIHINTCFDYYSWLKIFEFVNNFELKTTIFVPRCERNTISQMIYLSKFNKVKIFVGKCIPIILNPSLLTTLQETFNIKAISISKKDLEQILEDK